MLTTLQTLVNAIVDRELKLTEVTSKVRQLIGSGRSITKSNYFVMISKLTRKVQRLAALVSGKNLKFQRQCPDR